MIKREVRLMSMSFVLLDLIIYIVIVKGLIDGVKVVKGMEEDNNVQN